MTEDHPLVSLVYCSSATRPFSDEGLADLLATSRRNNDAHDITGLLLFREGEFVQILEGDRYDVEEAMKRISADSRHNDIRILLEEPIHARRFADWTMGYQPMIVPAPGEVQGYRDTFEDLRIGDHDMVGRALMELTMWFRVRESSAELSA